MGNTRGNKKLKNFFADLIRNDNFIREMEEVNKETNYSKKKKMVFNLCHQYAIDIYDFWFLNDVIRAKNPQKELKNLQDDEMIDSCQIFNNYEHYLNDNSHPYNEAVQKDIYLSTQYMAYPVSIGIRLLASQKDVSDFIIKKWEDIEYQLSDYRIKGKTNIRTKPKREMYDYVWANKNMNIKELTEKTKKAFPKENIVYFDIYKILQLKKEQIKKDLKLN